MFQLRALVFAFVAVVRVQFTQVGGGFAAEFLDSVRVVEVEIFADWRPCHLVGKFNPDYALEIEVAPKYRAGKGLLGIHNLTQKIARRPEAGGKLLFEEDLPNYRYSIYATNLNLPVSEIWNV